MQWFRWYHGTSTDIVFVNVACAANVRRSMVLAAWAATLEIASESTERGCIKRLNKYSLSALTGDKPTECERILKAMIEFGLITKTHVVNWWKRQRESDDVAIRVRAHREAKKAEFDVDEGKGQMPKNVAAHNPLKYNDSPPECNVTVRHQIQTQSQSKKESPSTDSESKIHTVGVLDSHIIESPQTRHIAASTVQPSAERVFVSNTTEVPNPDPGKEKEEQPPAPSLVSKTLPPPQLILVPDQPSKVAAQDRRGRNTRDEFDRFWTFVPKHRKVGKESAFKAFERILKKRIADVDTMVEGIARYSAWVDRNGVEPQFVAHPSTWLNAQRWTDELKDNAMFAAKDPETGLRYVSNGTKVLMDMAERGFDVRQLARF